LTKDNSQLTICLAIDNQDVICLQNANKTEQIHN